MSTGPGAWTPGRTDSGIVFETDRSVPDPERDWILFLHGVGLRRQIWRPWGAALSASYNLVSIDVPGYGESPLTTSLPRDLDTWAGYIDDVRHHLSIDALVLVGESLGGTASLNYAIKQPDAVKALVLCSTGFRGSMIPEVDKWRDLFASEGVAGWSSYMNERRFSPSDPAAAVAESEASQRASNAEVITSDGEMLLGVDLGPEMERVTAPTLLIQPGSSPFISREHAFLMEGLLPTSSLVLVGPSRHGVALAFAEESAVLTKHFLQKHIASHEESHR